MWNQVATGISKATGETFEITKRQSVSGGCINQGYALVGTTHTYFVKINQVSALQMFEAEVLGLKQMLETETIRVPKPLCSGVAGDYAYIVLEWLELGGGDRGDAWAEMGRKLAAMHQASPGTAGFGWEQNNTVGSTPQLNKWVSDWAEFLLNIVWATNSS